MLSLKLARLCLRASTVAIVTGLVAGQAAHAERSSVNKQGARGDETPARNGTPQVASNDAAQLPKAASQGSNAQGASAPALAPSEEGEIVVTAQKRRQNINDVGMSINAFSGSQLLKANVTAPGDLQKLVPGFTYSRSAYGTPVYTLRGIGFYDVVAAAPPAVSVYLDETPLPYPVMTKGVVYDVQRVEVLKGPQGTLFGQNATGGAMNFIANRPTRDFETGANLAYSSYNRVQADGFLSGPLSNTLRARLSGAVDYGGAWQRSFTRDEKHGKQRFYAGRLLLDWDATPDLKFQFNANGWVDKSDEQAGQIVGLVISRRTSAALIAAFNQYPQPPRNAREADWDPRPAVGENDTIAGTTHDGFVRDSKFGQLAARADYDLGGNTILTSITAYDALDHNQLIDGDGMNVNTYNISTGAKINTFSQELRLAGHAGRLQWLVGGNYQHDHIKHYGDTFNTLGTFPFRTAGSVADERINTYAVFANLDYALTEQLNLVAGVRYTDVRIKNEGCTLDGGDGQFAAFMVGQARAHGVNISIAPGECVTLDPITFQPTGLLKAELNEDNVPFRVGLNWKVAPRSLLYASVSRGYKAGTFSPVGALYAPALDPATQESVMAYEAGFKLGLAGNHLQLNGAAFLYDYTDKQVRGRLVDPVLGNINKTINVPKSRVHGAELEAVWTPDQHWRFGVNGSYTKSKITDQFINFTYGGVFKDMEGEPLPLTPKWQIASDADFDTPINGSIAGFVGAHLYYVSSAFSGLGAEDTFRTNGHANLDVRLGVRSLNDRWTATLFVNNLTNKYSWNFVATPGPDAIIRYANMPRVFGIRLSVRP